MHCRYAGINLQTNKIDGHGHQMDRQTSMYAIWSAKVNHIGDSSQISGGTHVGKLIAKLKFRYLRQHKFEQDKSLYTYACMGILQYILIIIKCTVYEMHTLASSQCSPKTMYALARMHNFIIKQRIRVKQAIC